MKERYLYGNFGSKKKEDFLAQRGYMVALALAFSSIIFSGEILVGHVS
jgi:hypothetical protein